RLLCYAMLLSFFFSCSADHRYLLSFPTRRSSDLGSAAVAGDLPALAGGRWATGLVRQRPRPRCAVPQHRLGQGPEQDERGHRRRSEEHTSELQSRFDLVCRLLLEKKKKTKIRTHN